ncbi:MAG: helix-turn-helix domain-containing protein [Proteobacteria bacterium]|nr:helix-turn-helix domain-containing protein [Pseudomonadota bacterium]
MDIHKNAGLTPLGREHMVDMVLGGQTAKAVSATVGVCPRTVRKWVERFRTEGLAGLQDRSARPDPAGQRRNTASGSGSAVGTAVFFEVARQASQAGSLADELGDQDPLVPTATASHGTVERR